MNNKLLKYLLISISLIIFIVTNRSNACDTLGTPVINIHNVILNQNGGSCVFFGSDSYDEDNGPPYSVGHGITYYEWWIETPSSDYFKVGEGSYLRFIPSQLPKGKYFLDLYVTDDEGNPPPEISRVAHSYGYADYCTIIIGETTIYTNTGKTEELLDWPAAGSSPRSPRYIFGENDPIIIEAKGFDNNAGYAEQIVIKAETYANLMRTNYITLEETGSNTGIFDNITSENELLYLSFEHGRTDSDDHKIQVIDEQVLTFSLMIAPGSYIYQELFNSVMVDRAEYSACGLKVFENATQEFKEQMDNINWYENSYEEFPNNAGLGTDMTYFIRNASDNLSINREADFLYVDSHGDCNGLLLDHQTESALIINPLFVSIGNAHWNNDVEWIWLSACSILHYGVGAHAWDDALFGSPKPAHMILSYYSVATPETSDTEDFFEYANDGGTIINAYYHANSDGWYDEPAAIVTHTDNISDKINEITADSSSTAMKYYWWDLSDDEWNYFSYTQQGANSSGEKVEYELPLSIQPEIAPLYVEMEPLQDSSSLKDLRHFKRNYGLDVYYRDFDANSTIIQGSETALQIAKNTLKNVVGKIPEPNESVSYENVFYVTDYELGQDVNLSSSTPLIRNIVYRHKHNGIPILGDVLSVHVSNNEIIKTKICWHKIKSEETKDKKKVKNVKESLVAAKENLSKKLKNDKYEEFKLKDATLCYYGFSESGKSIKKLVPAWYFVFENDNKRYCEYIDAHTNQPFNVKSDIDNALKKKIK